MFHNAPNAGAGPGGACRLSCCMGSGRYEAGFKSIKIEKRRRGTRTALLGCYHSESKCDKNPCCAGAFWPFILTVSAEADSGRHADSAAVTRGAGGASGVGLAGATDFARQLGGGAEGRWDHACRSCVTHGEGSWGGCLCGFQVSETPLIPPFLPLLAR